MSKPSRPYVRDVQFRGVVEGITYLDDQSNPQCHFFGGVPFGLPPVGLFRFQKPRSLPTCYRYGTKSNPGKFTAGCGLCPQVVRKNADEESWDEDCLQCNIWVPIEQPPEGVRQPKRHGPARFSERLANAVHRSSARLPAQPLRVPVLAGAAPGVSRLWRQPGFLGPEARSPVDVGEHQLLRRQPFQHHPLRLLGWSALGLPPARLRPQCAR
ncbi:hypothetical protein OPT61_g10344 [Boeremia exigua]|uniref:Uncharacterized protein n=1 Tax=Boeremia exigua TaxID=749465 RepID=A0ACC2HR19_9PLEO|nr:hypothetical protein OPT61_g10344 [Boeremia exigua]